MPVSLNGTNGLLQNYTTNTPTTGFSYTVTTPVTLFTPAGTLATGTVTMPASPSDGMTVTLLTSQTITALTISANAGQSITGAVTTLAANDSVTYMYRASNTTWYPYEIAAQSAPGGIRATTFTSNGTFTIPTSITAVKVTVLGAGGGGAAANNGFCPTLSGGPGGAGGMAISYLTGLTAGNTISVTIGAGGTAGTGTTGAAGGTGGASSISSGTQTISTVTANGGSGGQNASAGNLMNTGGSGGTASGGTINIQGQAAHGDPTNIRQFSGSTIFGAGFMARAEFNNATQAASGYGSGGGPATAGTAGLVIFEY